MKRIIKSMEEKYLLSSLKLVEDVFTKWANKEEGNPDNYRNCGFVSSYLSGIEASPNVHLPHPDCLMVKELCEDGLANMKGYVDYGFYETLH